MYWTSNLDTRMKSTMSSSQPKTTSSVQPSSLSSSEVKSSDSSTINLRGKTRSDVWNYFQKTSEFKVKCVLCKKEYSFSGGTTNLHNHLSSTHPFEYSKQSSSTSRQTTLQLSLSCLVQLAKEITNSSHWWSWKIYDQYVSWKTLDLFLSYNFWNQVILFLVVRPSLTSSQTTINQQKKIKKAPDNCNNWYLY